MNRLRGKPASNCHHRALSPHVGSWHRAGPAECYCSPSRSCARCVTSSAHRAGRTQHTPSTAAQTPPQFNPQRHAGVTTWSASRSASRSAGRRTFRGRSPTRGRGQGRAWRCRRWRLPKRRSPRRIRKSSGRRGGRAGAEAEEGDEPGCEGVEALGVRWPRANPRVAVCFR